jgi:hypothetical protein
MGGSLIGGMRPDEEDDEANAAQYGTEAEATQRYHTALEAGMSDHEAREEGWPSKPQARLANPDE